MHMCSCPLISDYNPLKHLTENIISIRQYNLTLGIYYKIVM